MTLVNTGTEDRTGTVYWMNKWIVAMEQPMTNCVICMVVRLRLMRLGMRTDKAVKV
jgi:hypothetical protein